MTSTPSCVPRYGTLRRPERPTIGGAVGVIARRLGKPLMPWQQYVADVLGEYEPDPRGGIRLFYDEYGLTVPRQSGKSTFIMAKAVHRCHDKALFGVRQRVVYTAQTRQKAREKWESDYVGDIEAARVFRALAHLGNGNEHLKFPNGSRFGIEANTEKAGHGSTLDEAFIDEAFAQADGRLEQAFGPAMITRRNKQLGWISTAGWLGGSPYLEDKVVIGRAAVEDGLDRGVAYFEWSAPEGADPGDEDVWWACMPALGHTISIEAIRAEYEKARRAGKLNDFRRAYLNLWVPKDAADEEIVAAALWSTAPVYDPTSTCKDFAGFGFDVQPGNQSASVGVAGARADGFTHLEILVNRPGTEWCVDYLVERWRKWRKPVAIDPTSPAGAFIDDLERAGVTVQKVSTQEYAGACQSFVTEANASRLRHQGWPALSAALGAARKRPIGDGGWGWARKQVVTDISPLVAVTLALHAQRHPLPARVGTFLSF